MVRRVAIVVMLLAALGGGAVWWYLHHNSDSGELVLYGNIDFRQVSLAFNGSERVAEILVEEGDRVKKDQVLARLDPSRLEPEVAQAEAQAAGQRANLARLKNGSRPEEIAQERANLESTEADAANAKAQYERQSELALRAVASQRSLEMLAAAWKVAEAKVAANQEAVNLLLAGSRAEDIQEAEAQLEAAEANLALTRHRFADAELKSPVDAVVRSRLIEPGEMASPTRTAFSLATISPKWTRAYISETQLGQIRPGMKATVTVDSAPGRPFPGWIGFISPVAEFTPKAVQTEELRTSLVYEVRVFVDDPDNVLRLGMPATVRPIIDPNEKPTVQQ